MFIVKNDVLIGYKGCCRSKKSTAASFPQDDPVYLFILKKRAGRQASQRGQDGWRQQVPQDFLCPCYGAV